MAARWEWARTSGSAREAATSIGWPAASTAAGAKAAIGIPHPTHAAVAVAGRPMTAAGDEAEINLVHSPNPSIPSSASFQASAALAEEHFGYGEERAVLRLQPRGGFLEHKGDLIGAYGARGPLAGRAQRCP